MLVSHRKCFIFTKTIKTAGTSIESYFEKYCMPEGEWKESHNRDEYVSDAGIIGYRGSDAKGHIWFNHMKAETIRNLVGQEVWGRYFKFSTVRNPFDKMISGFFMYETNKSNYNRMQRAKARLKRLLDTGNPIDRVIGESEIERFRSWIKKGGEIVDRDKYVIGDKECVDYYIRFENMNEDVRYVCDQLDLPFEASGIPEFKKGIRHHNVPIQDYYDEETEEIVRAKYSWECNKFGYEMPS